MILLLLISVCFAQQFPLHGKKKVELLVEKTIKLSEGFKNELVSAVEIFPNCEPNRKLVPDEALPQLVRPLPLDRSIDNTASEDSDVNAVTKKKFDQDSFSASEDPCNYGKPYMAPGLSDRCKAAKWCTLIELLCDGQVYNPSRATLPPNLNDCRVRSILCGNVLYNETTFGRECRIQKWVNGSTIVGVNPKEYYAPELQGRQKDVYGLNVQIACDHTLFGWQGWNFTCFSEDVTCTPGNISDCQVSRTTCFGYNMTTSCGYVTQTCDSNSALDSLCRDIINRTVSCVHPNDIRCKPRNITCGLATRDADTYNGDLSRCETIQSLECNGELIELPRAIAGGSNSACRIVELSCNGRSQIFTNQTRIPSECSVSRVICGALSLDLSVGCTAYMYGCRHQPSCSYTRTEALCGRQCQQPDLVAKCRCPKDFIGERCHLRRDIVVALHLQPGPGVEVVNAYEHRLTTSYKPEPLRFEVVVLFRDDGTLDTNSTNDNDFTYAYSDNVTGFYLTDSLPPDTKVYVTLFTFAKFGERSEPLCVGEVVLRGTTRPIVQCLVDVLKIAEIDRVGNKIFLNAHFSIRSRRFLDVSPMLAIDYTDLPGLDARSYYQTNKNAILTAVITLSVVLAIICYFAGKYFIANILPRFFKSNNVQGYKRI